MIVRESLDRFLYTSWLFCSANHRLSAHTDNPVKHTVYASQDTHNPHSNTHFIHDSQRVLGSHSVHQLVVLHRKPPPVITTHTVHSQTHTLSMIESPWIAFCTPTGCSAPQTTACHHNTHSPQLYTHILDHMIFENTGQWF
jgi:hypothetical protein